MITAEIPNIEIKRELKSPIWRYCTIQLELSRIDIDACSQSFQELFENLQLCGSFTLDVFFLLYSCQKVQKLIDHLIKKFIKVNESFLRHLIFSVL